MEKIPQPNLFDEESTQLEAAMRQRCAELAELTGRSVREIAVELGQVMIVMGTKFMGKGLGIPEAVSLPIAKSTLRGFVNFIKPHPISSPAVPRIGLQPATALDS